MTGQTVKYAFALFCIVTLVSAQRNVNTGEGRYTLFYPPGGATGSSSLSAVLPLSFTFEAWIMHPFPDDGSYKTICARYAPGPNGENHNRWADWNFQVQATGTLNFFMGNSRPDIYGVLIPVLQFPRERWTHVAFTVDTPAGTVNPRAVTIYVDGVAVASRGWSTGGTRRVLNSAPIVMGGYQNQDDESFPDPDPNKWWRGYIDEVRFWSGVRTGATLSAFSQRVVGSVPSLPDTGLLAYYRHNEREGTFVGSATGSNHAEFTNPESASPVWKFSGAKIHVDMNIENAEEIVLTLPGVPDQQFLEFQFLIMSLPAVGELWSQGRQIKATPYTLPSNQVTYRSDTNGNRRDTSFRYYGSNPDQTEDVGAVVFLTMDPVGQSKTIIDACGVAGGDNSTCQCLPLPFHGYTLNDIERVLLLWEIEQTTEIVHNLQLQIESIQKQIPQAEATDLQLLINSAQQFLNVCMSRFVRAVNHFTEEVRDISPIPIFVD